MSLTGRLGHHPKLVGALCGYALALALGIAVLFLVQTDIRELLDELNMPTTSAC